MKKKKQWKKPPGYSRWCSMKERCNSPKCKDWPRYGGRGITVCKRWAPSFTAFITDVGHPPFADLQLDRIDNDRGYEPGNVRWATLYEQQVNSANKNKMVWIEVDGVRLSFKAWARKLGVSPQVLRYRARILGDYALAVRSVRDVPVAYGNRLGTYRASKS